MKNSLRFCFLLLLLATGLFHPAKAANNAAAGELMYRWVSGSTYDLYVKFYRDCAGGPEPTTLTVCYANTCNSFQSTIILNKISGNLPAAACGSGANGDAVSTISAGCANILTTCQDPNATAAGYQEFWYSARVTLPAQCNYWRFSTSIATRNPAITNLFNPAMTALYLEATLFSVAGTGENPGNSNPCFNVPPIHYIQNNISVSFASGAIDPDGDSLTYQLIMPRDQGSSCTGINTAFSSPAYNLLTNPFATGNSFYLNPVTGQMTFIPAGNQVANIAILVREYQNGVLRGSTVREMQIVTLPGTNALPQPLLPTTITGGQLLNGRYEGCINQPLQFCFPVVGADMTAQLVATDNHNNPPPGTSPAMPAASLTYNGLYQDSLNVCFSWTPTSQDTGFHEIIINVRDTICRPPGYPNQRTFPLPIYISATAPVAGTINVSGSSPTYTFSTSGIARASSYYWDFGDGTTDTTRTPTHTFTATGSHTITLYAANGCGADSATVTINIASGIAETTTPEKAIQLFPSPATADFVTVTNTASQSMTKISILNVVGAVVRQPAVINGKEQRINISGLPAGTYLVRIELDGGALVVQKLQINP